MNDSVKPQKTLPNTPRKMLNWDDLRFFIVLAESRTLSAAARILKTTHVTVSRRLQSLEQDMGCTLLQRCPNGYHLTSQGNLVLMHALRMRENAQMVADTTAPGDGHRGTIRLSTIRTLADHFLAPRLFYYLREHPAVQVELSTETHNVSISRREADIALRLARPVEGDSVARRIALICYGFYRSRQISAPEASFIGFAGASEHIPEAIWLNRFTSKEMISFRSDSPFIQMAAAEAGVGVALLPHYIAIQNPRLELASIPDAPPPRELWLIRPKEHHDAARIRSFVDYLIALFEKNRTFFEGGDAFPAR